MLEDKKLILMTAPRLSGEGGVANFLNSISPYLKLPSIDIRTLEIGGSMNNKWHHFFTDQIHFRTLLNLSPSLCHINPSLNFKSFIRDGLFVRQATNKNIPTLVFWHGWDPVFEAIVSKSLKIFFYFTFLNADAHIVLANNFRSKLIQWGIKKPIYLSTTAVDEKLVEDFNIESKLLRLKNKSTIDVLFLSRVEKNKGVIETIDAVSELNNSGYRVNLTIAGDGSALSEINTKVQSLRSNHYKIRIMGHIGGELKKSIFQNHDIFCLPTSHGEGLPVSILEAMTFGMPIVTTSVGGIIDFFQPGKMGYFVSSKNSSEIANAIISIIKSKDLFIKMCFYNYEFANNRFKSKKVASQLLTNYNELLGNSLCYA